MSCFRNFNINKDFNKWYSGSRKKNSYRENFNGTESIEEKNFGQTSYREGQNRVKIGGY